ncbi:E3 ubiquitin-protein ligase [Schistosoma japonicum]|nr:E3 ubiquitin-protein ligase [Schistosoma japonicum]
MYVPQKRLDNAADMPTSSTDVSEKLEKTSIKWAKLLSVHDSSMHELSQEVITIGSSEECSIVIKHEQISSSHCLLMKDPDNVIWLYDCSETGTYCNNDGQWLRQDCVTLHTGDYFHLVWDDIDAKKRIGFCILFADTVCKRLDSPGECDKMINMTVLQPQSLSSSSELIRPSTSTDDTDLETCLTCVICGDIYFECCSVQPCLHSFCTLCWLKWNKFECPMCRKSVTTYAKNHQLNNLVDVFLRKHPEKLKSELEQNEIKQEITRLSRPSNQSRRYNNRARRNRERFTVSEGGRSLLRASSSNVFPIVPAIAATIATPTSITIPATGNTSTSSALMPTYIPINGGCVVCAWLPPTNDYHGSSSSNVGINLVDRGSAHCYCACCNRPMPFQTTLQLHGMNRTECEVCRHTFCSLINPHGCSTCDGYCLSRVQDLTRYNSIPRTLLLNNRIETRILDDYLTSQGISIPIFISQCLSLYINTTVIYPSCILNENSLICKNCGEYLLSQLAYQYRVSICSDELPNDVITKPNCYYGRYCRYQSYNYHHARRFNHICERSF